MNVSQLHQTFKPSQEFSVKLDLLKENVDIASVRQRVEEKQPTQMQAIKLAAIILTPAEGNNVLK